MTAAQPPAELIDVHVDLVEVSQHGLTVRDRRTGTEHTLGFEGVLIGADESGDGYTVTAPPWMFGLAGQP